jgi:hypothetical protein
MSISSVNGDPRGDYPVWRFKLVGEFFLVGMEEKVPPEKGLKMGTIFHHPPCGDSVPKNY